MLKQEGKDRVTQNVSIKWIKALKQVKSKKETHTDKKINKRTRWYKYDIRSEELKTDK